MLILDALVAPRYRRKADFGFMKNGWPAMTNCILHSSPIWLPQTQTWMCSQVRGLQEKGIDTHVVCERIENFDQFQVAHLHCFANEPRWRQLYEKGLRHLGMRAHLDYLIDIGKEAGARIIHSHFGHVGWRNLEVARQLRARHCVTFYGWDVNRLPKQDQVWRRRYRELFAEVDEVLCEGSHMAQCIVELGCSQDKVHVQHLGVDTEKVPFSPRVRRAGEPFRILIAASFREKKGIPDAIEAIGMLGRDVSIELTIIGDAGSDKESQQEKTRIIDALHRNGLMSRARLLGYQSHDVFFREAYAHHVFISPSFTASDGDTEGGAPVSLIEMTATGMPIVSTRHCDIPEVILNGQSGWLAEERDIQGLYGHLRWFFDHDTEWLPMLQAGRRHIENEYSLPHQIERLIGLYNKLLLQNNMMHLAGTHKA